MTIYVQARAVLERTGDEEAAWQLGRTDPGLLPHVTRAEWLAFTREAIARNPWPRP
jgi:hypothetical protein